MPNVTLKREGFNEYRQIETNEDLTNIKNLLNKKISESPSLDKIKILQETLTDLSKIKAYFYHLEVSNTQRKNYNNLKKNIKSDELFIELDWKQKVDWIYNTVCFLKNSWLNYFQNKIIIGLSPRQVSKEFYNQQQRSLIGFGVYYREKDRIRCMNVDMISDNLTQTGNSSVCSFR